MRLQNEHYYIILLLLLSGIYFKADLKMLNPLEDQMKALSAVGVIAFIDKFLTVKEIVKKPKRLQGALSSRAGRFALLYVSMFAITTDFEIALLVSCSYLVALHILRTDQEKAETPYLL